MQIENEKVIQVGPAIMIAEVVEIEGHQLVSKKLLEITNHILTELPLLRDAFELVPNCISKISFLPNFEHLDEEHQLKFGMFNYETAEITVNLQSSFKSAVDSVKEGNNMELMCVRAHLWFQLLSTLWHEIMHAVSYAIDPEVHLGEDRETLEEIVAEQAMDELTNLVRDFECEPPTMADEPFFGTRFMAFFINEVKDNAEAWALAQNSIYQYNERNSTHVLWKDGDAVVSSFRQWFKAGYEHHTWDDDVKPLAELKFSLATPTTAAIEAPEAGALDKAEMTAGDMLDEVKALDEVPWEESPSVPEALIQPSDDVLNELEAPEEVAGDYQVETVPEEAANTHVEEVMEAVHAAFPQTEEPVDAETLAFQNSEDEDPGDFDVDEPVVAQPELPDFPSPTPASIAQARNSVAATSSKLSCPKCFDMFTSDGNFKICGNCGSALIEASKAAPPATVANGTPLPEATPEPTFAPTSDFTPPHEAVPLPDPAPPTGATPLPASPQQQSWPQDLPPAQAPVQQPAAAGSGYSGQKLRTGLPNHNFTGEQMRYMCEQVFLRCVNHIFAKCGWTPGGNPPFTPELRGAIMEPISMIGIPGIENFLIGMDIIDAASGTYVINSPATAHNGMVKGKVTQKQHLPSYTLYFNYNGMEIKRFIAPQNQWKMNKAGNAYSMPAQAAQQGAQIAWIMDGDDSSTGNKWRAKVENGVIEWLV